MAEPVNSQVTQYLQAIDAGDPHAAEDLLPLVYEELRKLAADRMAKEPPGQTLQATALVHEAYLRLLGDDGTSWENRAHFFAAAAHAMRRILVERARKRRRTKHGGGRARLSLSGIAGEADQSDDDVLALDEALDGLKDYDDRKWQVVMMRHFAGLTIEDTARCLDVSPATVKNDWTFARAWLHRHVCNGADRASENTDDAR